MAEIQKTNRAVEIVTLHNEINSMLKTSLEKALQIGKLLIEQKKSCLHGEFTAWIKDNLPFTKMTASNYMRLHRNREFLKSKRVLLLNEAYELLPRKTIISQVLNNDDAKLYIDQIEPNPFFDISHLITESISHWKNVIKRFNGMPYWITVVRYADGKYQNVVEHEHYYALQNLGIKQLPVSVVTLRDKDMKWALEQFDYPRYNKRAKRIQEAIDFYNSQSGNNIYG